MIEFLERMCRSFTANPQFGTFEAGGGGSSLDFRRWLLESLIERDTADEKSPVLEIFHSAVKTLLFNIFACGFQHFSDP